MCVSFHLRQEWGGQPFFPGTGALDETGEYQASCGEGGRCASALEGRQGEARRRRGWVGAGSPTLLSCFCRPSSLLARPQGKGYSVNVPLVQGIDTEQYLALYKPIIA